MSECCENCKFAVRYEYEDAQKYLDDQYEIYKEQPIATRRFSDIFLKATEIQFRNTHVSCRRFPQEQKPALDYWCAEYKRKK